MDRHDTYGTPDDDAYGGKLRNFFKVLVKYFQTTKPGRPWKDAEFCLTISAR
ncbi:hypothetical protein [aff. Roholtiella sp. LEGE 12411]|uniref:hypothetical protein n=1 Tax=aff. Roholtiella sp. LEGE 12411 TaxID=1828822 RepID=UPI0018815458|nr:hypothetical protein [aff. Roholtiella sp. LEGE 12411]MBE9037659.1 hypothetical protein [aff. Roholtiella sp. LEGE 12411]